VDELPDSVLLLVTDPVVVREIFPVFVIRLVLEGVTELDDVLEAGGDLETLEDPVELLEAELEREDVPDVDEVLDDDTDPVVVRDTCELRDKGADPVVVLLDVIERDLSGLADDVLDCVIDFVEAFVGRIVPVLNAEGVTGQVARAVLVPVVVRVEVFDMVPLILGTIPASSKYRPGISYSTIFCMPR